MEINSIYDLLSEHNLSENTLGFIEEIKFECFHLEEKSRFELISYINKQPEIIKKIYNTYYDTGFGDSIKLSIPSKKTSLCNCLEKINKKRKSIRKFSDSPITYEELSLFLNLFYSITGEEEMVLNEEKIKRNTRNIASGGALYPTEVYVVNNKIDSFPKGAYRYNVYESQLDLIDKLDSSDKIDEFYEILMQPKNRKKSSIEIEKASCFIILTSVLNRSSFKYKDFGVLLSFIEIGSFIHSAYLTCSAMDIACCPFGGILNNKMNQFLDLKNPLHYPVICIAIGNKNI